MIQSLNTIQEKRGNSFYLLGALIMGILSGLLLILISSFHSMAGSLSSFCKMAGVE